MALSKIPKSQIQECRKVPNRKVVRCLFPELRHSFNPYETPTSRASRLLLQAQGAVPSGNLAGSTDHEKVSYPSHSNLQRVQ